MIQNEALHQPGDGLYSSVGFVSIVDSHMIQSVQHESSVNHHAHTLHLNPKQGFNQLFTGRIGSQQSNAIAAHNAHRCNRPNSALQRANLHRNHTKAHIELGIKGSTSLTLRIRIYDSLCNACAE